MDGTTQTYHRHIFEYGKNKEGYWTNELFLEQIEVARSVADPPRVFKHSCGHTAYAPDALVVGRLNPEANTRHGRWNPRHDS